MIMPAYPWAALGLILKHDIVSIHTPMLETALISALASLARRQVIATHHGDLILPAEQATAPSPDRVCFVQLMAGDPRPIAYSEVTPITPII
jgi:hypothetical protein